YRVPYCEISGRGPPPDDLTDATLGDIYIDTSPEEYALYGKVAEPGANLESGWKRWFDPRPGKKMDAVVVSLFDFSLPPALNAVQVKHPYFSDRLLWCSSATGINW
ncbi:hypothetical protein B0H16DRAFT_1232501, partial [Mycena metata]